MFWRSSNFVSEVTSECKKKEEIFIRLKISRYKKEKKENGMRDRMKGGLI